MKTASLPFPFIAVLLSLGLLVPTLAGAQGVSCLDAPDGSPLDVVCVDNDGDVRIDAGATQDLTRIDTGIFVEGGDGDLDSNGLIDLFDILILVDHLGGASLLPPAQYAIADINGDGRVSFDDLGILLQRFLGTPKDVAVQQIESAYGMTSPTVFFVNSGVSVGVGTNNPIATLDVQGSLHVNGPITQRTSTVLHPDYVFEPDYELESIEEHTAFMLREKHLEAVPRAQPGEDGTEVLDLGALQFGMLEELEKAHLYIAELHERLEAQQEEVAALRAMMEETLSR